VTCGFLSETGTLDKLVKLFLHHCISCFNDNSE